MMIYGVVEPFLLHRWLSVCIGVAKEGLMRWIANKPKYHYYLASAIKIDYFKFYGTFLFKENNEIRINYFDLNSMPYGLNDAVKDTSPLNFK